MPDSRIKDLVTQATSPAADDFFVIDGAGNGTRKLPANPLQLDALNATGQLSCATAAITGDITMNGGRSVTSSLNSRRSAQAWVFDGTAGATLQGLSAFGTGDFAVDVVVNPSTVATYRWLLHGATNAFGLFIDTNGTVNTSLVAVGDNTASTGTVTVGKTRRVTYVRSGTTGTYYFDGVAAGTTTDSRNYSVAPTSLGGTSTNIFSGTLGPVSIINASISAAEVATLAETGRLPSWCHSAQVGLPAGVAIAHTGSWSSDGTATLTNNAGQTISWSDTNNGYCYTQAAGSNLRAVPLGKKVTATFTIANLIGTVLARLAASGTGGSNGAQVALVNGVNYLPEATAGSTGLLVDISWSAASSGDLTGLTFTPLGSVLNLDPDQPGSGNVWRNTNGTGDAVKGATGIQWALPATQLERADVLTRTQSAARRQMIQLSGAQGRSTATLGIGNYSGPCGIYVQSLYVPTSDPVEAFALFQFSSGGSPAAARTLRGYFYSDGSLRLILYGASASEFRVGYVPNFRRALSGKTVSLEMAISAIGVLTVIANGDSYAVLESVTSNAPSWTDIKALTLYDVGTFGTDLNYNYAGSLVPPSLLLGNLTAAESARWHATGEWPQWVYVSGGAGGNAMASAWTNGDFTSFTGASATGFTAVAASGAHFATTGSGYVSYKKGQQIRVTGTLARNNGKTVFPSFYLLNQSSLSQSLTADGNFTLTFTSDRDQSSGGGFVFLANGDADITISNWKIENLGLAFHPSETWDGRGGIWPDVSGAYRHLTLAASGVTPAIVSAGDAGTYGNIYVVDGVTAQSIPNGASYTKLTPFTNNGASSDCTVSAANDQITLTRAGKYMVDIAWSGAVGTANVTVDFAGFLDSTELNQVHASRKFSSLDIGALSCSGIITATANQVLTLQAKHDNGAAVNVTTHDCSMNVFWLGI